MHTFRLLFCGFCPLFMSVGYGQVEAPDASPQRDQAKTTASDQPEKWFELFVRGPDGKPVPQAEVEFRTRLKPTKKDYPVGKFVKQGKYGTFVNADQYGRVVYIPKEKVANFTLSIKVDGFGPFHAKYDARNWPADAAIELIAELDAAWSIGGKIVDEDGNPIEGAEVDPSIEYKKPPEMRYQLGIGTNIRSDKDGNWSFHSVPESKSSVHVSIDHPDFKPERRGFPRAQYGIEKDQQKFEPIVLSRGIVLKGIVTDDSGEPIEGALIRSKFLNEIRRATTDADGRYELAGCEPGLSRVVVSAKEKATDMRAIRLVENPEPVNFEMKPGGHVRIVVQDENGDPIPKARIFYQDWRGDKDYFEFDFKDQYADENGVWEWNEAPLDEFYADICRPGGMYLAKQKIVAREEEYVFRPPPALVIFGNVTNKETGKPLSAFRVVPGAIFNGNQRHPLQRDAFPAANGKYHLKQLGGYEQYFVRIEADGFEPTESRKIDLDEGTITIDFKLTPLEGMAAEKLTSIILSPTGKPARDATIALLTSDASVSIRGSEIDRRSARAELAQTDGSGRFTLQQPAEDFHILITHPEGFAFFYPENGQLPDSLKLTAWATIKGVFQVGDERMSGVELELNTRAFPPIARNGPRIHTYVSAWTGKNGEFAIERVVPGPATIGRAISFIHNEGADKITSSKPVPIELVSGETTEIQLGGDGVPVIGRLQLPEDVRDDYFFRFVQVTLIRGKGRPEVPQPPEELRGDPEKATAWTRSWLNSPAGKAYYQEMAAYRNNSSARIHYLASVREDGRFRIDDVPPGEYELSARGVQNFPFKLPEQQIFVDLVTDDLGDLILTPLGQ